jgi:hypothetical protein
MDILNVLQRTMSINGRRLFQADVRREGVGYLPQDAPHDTYLLHFADVEAT